MANETMTLINTVTVGVGGSSTITFSSIPSTYTDLQIMISGRSNDVAIHGPIALTFNGTTGNWSQRYLLGDGSTATAGTNAYGLNPNSGWGGYVTATNATSNTFSNTMLYISNYAGNTYKSVSVDSVSETNATNGVQLLEAALWSNTSAISSVTLTSSGSFVQYTTASIYGILKGSGGATVS